MNSMLRSRTIKASVSIFLAILLYLAMLRCAKTDEICEANKIQKIHLSTRRVIGCEECVWCPIGFGANVTCGGSVIGNTPIRCAKCLPGTSYSSEYSSNSCTDCSKCGPHRTITRDCTGISDRKCGDCDTGFYFDSTTSMCERCSYCCGDGENFPMKKCITDGMPTNQQCSYGRSDCTPVTAQTTMTHSNETEPTSYPMINPTTIKLDNGTAKLGNVNADERGPLKYLAKKPLVTTVLAVSITIGVVLLVIVLAIVWKFKHRAAKEPQQNEHLPDPVQDTQTARPQHTWV